MAAQKIGYWDRVKAMAFALKGDGCTNAPDLTYRRCCDEHDIHYRTGETLAGEPISRTEADAALFRCMRKTGKTPVVGRLIVPAFYWLGVRLFGGGAWKGQK